MAGKCRCEWEFWNLGSGAGEPLTDTRKVGGGGAGASWGLGA